MQRVSLTERKLRWSVKESKFAIDSETNGEMERETNVRRGRSGVEREDEASSGTSEHDLSAPRSMLTACFKIAATSAIFVLVHRNLKGLVCTAASAPLCQMRREAARRYTCPATVDSQTAACILRP